MLQQIYINDIYESFTMIHDVVHPFTLPMNCIHFCIKYNKNTQYEFMSSNFYLIFETALKQLSLIRVVISSKTSNLLTIFIIVETKKALFAKKEGILWKSLIVIYNPSARKIQ